MALGLELPRLLRPSRTAMNPATRIKLSVMMFLQYAIWSVWALMLVPHLIDLKVSDSLIGWVMACGGLGSIIGPFIMGQLADRYFATEKVLAFSHLAGGMLLIAASYCTTFWPIFLLMLVYCTLYFPTVGLTNSLTFRALGEEHASLFAPIRLWGTIGWLLATFLVGRYLNLSSESAPALKPLFDLVGEPGKMEVLRIPGLISLVLGLYCFALPHTPPAIPAMAASAPKEIGFCRNPRIDERPLVRRAALGLRVFRFCSLLLFSVRRRVPTCGRLQFQQRGHTDDHRPDRRDDLDGSRAACGSADRDEEHHDSGRTGLCRDVRP